MKIISGNPFIKKEDDGMFLDNVSVNTILKSSSSPSMIFLENRIRQNIRVFKRVFESLFNNFHCFYSMKANYLPDICNVIRSEEVGVLVVSPLELNAALKAEFPSSGIIAGGPLLTQDFIELCLENKIKEIIAYDLEDLKLINRLAARKNIVQDVCIRIKSQKYGSRLGISSNSEKIEEIRSTIKNCGNINCVSLLSHLTTQMNNIHQYSKNVLSILDTCRNLNRSGIDIKNLNLGGGFPEAVIMTEKQLSRIVHVLRDLLENHDTTFKRIYLEPGRYFVGDSGVFISKIVRSTEDRWIFLDIGNHICPKFARNSLRFYNISQINESHKYKTSIAGILPTDQDVLVKDYFFTKNLIKGDNVLITNVGAYTLTFSNRFPYRLPELFLVKDHECRKIFDPVINHDFALKLP